MGFLLPILLLSAIIAVAGCTQAVPATGDGQATPDGSVQQPDGTIVKPDGTIVKPDGTMVAPDGTMTKPDGTMVKPDGTMLLPDGTIVPPASGGGAEDGNPAGGSVDTAGLTKFADNYYRYDKAAYEQAKAAGRVVFLDFHADWCPICNAERPGILAGFSQLSYPDVIGFQVHYNDGQTTQDDKNLAKALGVSYQHTKIILDSTGAVALKTLEVFDDARVVSEIGKARAA